MGANETATWDLAGCSILFGLPIDGFGEGNAIEITAGVRWTTTEGGDGGVLFSKTNSKLYTVKIGLMQHSSANAKLMAAAIADDETPGGLLLPFTFRDPNSKDTFFSPKARIVQLPNFIRSNKANSPDWMIAAAEGVPFYGGV